MTSYQAGPTLVCAGDGQLHTVGLEIPGRDIDGLGSVQPEIGRMSDGLVTVDLADIVRRPGNQRGAALEMIERQGGKPEGPFSIQEELLRENQPVGLVVRIGARQDKPASLAGYAGTGRLWAGIPFINSLGSDQPEGSDGPSGICSGFSRRHP